jgi:hypothetical protein
MEKQIDNPNILHACDYTIKVMQTLKNDLTLADGEKKEINWAIKGLIVSLVSSLVVIMMEVLNDHGDFSENRTARDDLLEIQRQFNEMIFKMLTETKNS